MAIRAATEDDIEAIRRIARRSWEADYPDILSRETAESGVDEWYAPEELQSELSHPRSILAVATKRSEIVGFVHAISGDDIGHVLRLYVDPGDRRRGVGRQLFDHVVGVLTDLGCDRVGALVLADNDLGVAFYRSLGFEAVDEASTRIGDTTYRELSMERPITK